MKWCSSIPYHLVAQRFQDTWGKSEEEEESAVLSNQRKRCCKHCAGVVPLECHVLYVVVSGGGHRRQSKTQVSYDFVAMKTVFFVQLYVSVGMDNRTTNF